MMIPALMLLATAFPLQDDLGKIVVHERITRYCGDNRHAKKIDTFDAAVEIVAGVEQYTEVRRKNQIFASIAQIPGLWSVGELATMFRTTQEFLGAGPRFELPASKRAWYVTVGPRVYWLGFRGEIDLSDDSRLRKISWVSDPLPAEIAFERIEWEVSFAPTEIAGKEFTLPRSAVYKAIRRGMPRAEWNVTEFLDYARYGSEVRVSFDR